VQAPSETQILDFEPSQVGDGHTAAGNKRMRVHWPVRHGEHNGAGLLLRVAVRPKHGQGSLLPLLETVQDSRKLAKFMYFLPQRRGDAKDSQRRAN
jgi:hypothetical protein